MNRKALKLLSENGYSTHPVLACACLHTAIKENKEHHIFQQVVITFRNIGHKMAKSSVFSALEALKRYGTMEQDDLTFTSVSLGSCCMRILRILI